MTTNTDFANLFENTIAVSVSFDGLSIRRTANLEGVEVDADKDRVELKTRILQCPEMRAIRNLRSNLRRLISDRRRGLTLPARVFRDGVFLIPVSMFEEVDTMLQNHAATLTALVNDLSDVYEQRIAEDKLKLRSKFNVKHYPAKSALHAVWGIEWRYFSLAPSAVLAKVSPAAYSAEQAKVAEQMTEIGNEIIVSMRGAAAEIVAKMRDALGNGEDGKPRVFRDSQVENLIEFINLATKKNVMNDEALMLKLAEMRSLLKNTGEEIRSDADLRAKLQQSVSAIAIDLTALVEEAKDRSIRLPEEDITPEPEPAPVAQFVETCKKHKGESKPCARCKADAAARRAKAAA